MDTEIKAMQQRLGSNQTRAGDSLQQVLVLALQKRKQMDELARLEQERREQEAKRQSELARLKKEEAERRFKAFEKDLADYREVKKLQVGKALEDQAWQALIKKYPGAAKGIQSGDENSLYTVAKTEFLLGMDVTTNSLDMKFVCIPSGYFLTEIGFDSDQKDDTQMLHQDFLQFITGISEPRQQSLQFNKREFMRRVTISKSFYIQTTEVTQAQWRAVMGSNPSFFKSDNHPVDNVSWNDAQRFISKLNLKEGIKKYRLPTEAEWEYAARAGSAADYCFGDDGGKLAKYAWFEMNTDNKTYPVAQKQANAWSLYDMHGNVWEWVQDWYDADYYAGSHSTDPKGPDSGMGRVIKGGGWNSSALECRFYQRSRFNPGAGRSFIGFRLVREP